MKKRLITLTLLSLITLMSCGSIPTEKVMQANSATNEVDLSGFKEIAEGVYANYMPGFYDETINLEFKTKNPNYQIKYTREYGFDENTSVYNYSKPIKIQELGVLEKEEYPCTTSVDGILANRGEGRCISDTYNNNIQRPGAYRLFPKENVICIKVIDKEKNKVVFTRGLTYFVGSGMTTKYTIPVISISMPYAELFGPEGFYNNIFNDIEKRAYLEYFDPVSGEYFFRNTQIKIGGNWSQGYPQRTLNLNFNKDEHGEKNTPVTANVFKDDGQDSDLGKKITKITRFRLHNGGNCFEAWTGFGDALIQRIAQGADVATQSYRPAIVYINGEYWGLMPIREHMKTTFFRDNYGLDKDDVCLYSYKGNWQFDDGEDEKAASKKLKEMQIYVDNKNFTSDTVYQTFCEKYIDIQSLMDIMLLHAYAGNWDFVGNANNCKMWATLTTNDKNPYNDGKWRFCMHDVDFAFNDYTNYLDKNSANPYHRLDIFEKCLRNATFREDFLLRAEELTETLLNPLRCSRILSQMASEVKPYKMDSSYRWGQNKTFYNSWIDECNNCYTYFQRKNATFLNEVQYAMNQW